MKRLLMQSLVKWKDNKYRKPLILKGVRQCGKTWLLKEFGRECFDDAAYFSFDGNDELAARFEGNLDVRRIISELEILRGAKIDSAKTLIIFDEIQSCPRALSSLKHFAEDAPEYRVACAGSYLGMALSKPTSFPVGKVDFLTLRPMGFLEFLLAHDEDMLVDDLGKLTSGGNVPELFAPKLERYLRTYYITGGMPEALSVWLDTENIEALEVVQSRILDSYELDFVKHAPVKEYGKLAAIWNSIPEQLAKESGKFVFGHAKAGARAKDLENALEWLIAAGYVYKVTKVEKPFIPLSSYANPTYFKLYLADVGILRRLSRLPASAILESADTFTHFKGTLTENYALTELVNIYDAVPCFWKSDNKAEVDFVIQDDAEIVPIEVKSETDTKSKSLGVYRAKYSPERELKFTMKRNIDSNVPLYLIWHLGKLLSRR